MHRSLAAQGFVVVAYPRSVFASSLFSYGSPPIGVYWISVQHIQIRGPLFFCLAWLQALLAIRNSAFSRNPDPTRIGDELLLDGRAGGVYFWARFLHKRKALLGLLPGKVQSLPLPFGSKRGQALWVSDEFKPTINSLTDWRRRPVAELYDASGAAARPAVLRGALILSALCWWGGPSAVGIPLFAPGGAQRPCPLRQKGSGYRR